MCFNLPWLHLLGNYLGNMQHPTIFLRLQLFFHVNCFKWLCYFHLYHQTWSESRKSLFITSEIGNAFGTDLQIKSPNICKSKSITLNCLIFVLGCKSSRCYKINPNYVFTCNKVGKENAEIICTTSVWCDFLLHKTISLWTHFSLLNSDSLVPNK